MQATSIDATIDRWLDCYGGERIELGELLCDAHPDDATALVYDGPSGVERLSYGELGERSRRLAGALREAGVEAGDRVAVMLAKSPELLVALMAIWRAGAVHVPLFTAFGPDAASFRVRHSGARLAIVAAEHRAKVDVAGVPTMCVGAGREGDLDFAAAVAHAAPFDGVARVAEDLMFLLYTSGTTGDPKGVEVPVRSLASIHSYMHYGLDLRPEDVYWNMADPGWAYGLWYGVVGPLLLGHATLMQGRPFEAETVFATIAEHGVTNLAGAPTVFRALRAAGVPDGFRERSRLGAISSAGEPLNAELLEWSARELGVAIHDHYGQSELGMVVGFAQHAEVHRAPVAGSMGVALPGFAVAVVGEDGEQAAPGVDGELAVDVERSPLMWFHGYYADLERTAERFPHGARWYLTADAARRDEDGLLRFASRADDVITSSGYRIGPFEVENALIAHAAVAEAAVIGTPDELRGEAVTAFVVPVPGQEPTPELAEELAQFVKARLAKHAYPRHVRFLDELPRTPSGKVRRIALRAQWGATELDL
jgi:acetyl-CoA synthetase